MSLLRSFYFSCCLIVLPCAAQSTPIEPAKASPKPAVTTPGPVNTQSAESRRNENVQFNLIDNNALKDLNIRLGTTATIVREFQAQRQYFGVEFGNTPTSPPHLSVTKLLTGVHGLLNDTLNNSIFNARTFFQVGPVQPAHENQYGINLVTPLWTKAFLTIDGGMQQIRGSVNGNVLIPLPSERNLLAADPPRAPCCNASSTPFPTLPPIEPTLIRVL